MKRNIYKFKETMFIYPGETANWHFLPLPKKIGQEIKVKFAVSRRGFGSLPVLVTIGKTVWTTSIFPSSHSGSYLLPVKAKVRQHENIQAGEKVEFQIQIKI